MDFIDWRQEVAQKDNVGLVPCGSSFCCLIIAMVAYLLVNAADRSAIEYLHITYVVGVF